MSKLSPKKCAVFALFAFCVWLIPCLGELTKWLPRQTEVLVCGIALVGFMAGFQIVGRVSLPSNGIRSRWPLIIAVGFVAILIFATFPMIHAGRFGSGTDRADALIVGLHALLHGSYPYYFHTPQGNLLTPMSGAFLLALPFYLLGNVALQNILWVVGFAWFLTKYYQSATAALLCFIAYILFCTVSMQDLITGGDYLVNIIYVALSFYWVALVYQRPGSKGKRLAAAVLYAIALCSRPIFVLATLPVISAFVLQKSGKRALFNFLAVNALVAFVLVGPFYLYDTKHFTPLQTSGFYVRWAPAFLHIKILLPCVTLLAAASSFWRKLDIVSIFGAVVIAFAAMFLPYCFLVAVMQGWTLPVLLHQWTFSLPLPSLPLEGPSHLPQHPMLRTIFS